MNKGAPDGTALPCHNARNLPGLDLPRVQDQPLADIWARSQAFNAYRGDSWMKPPCRDCDERHKDFGGCRCQAFQITGDATQADPVCSKSPQHDKVVTLVREVSWSNVRDKLNIGLFDAAHLLAPVAIASSLGLGHVKVPIVAPFNLGLNGNAITVSPALHAAIMGEIEGDATDPMATALALARVVANRRKSGAEPLTFGMTFPFSTHNYQLRFWMAVGGVDPDSGDCLVLAEELLRDEAAEGVTDDDWPGGQRSGRRHDHLRPQRL